MLSVSWYVWLCTALLFGLCTWFFLRQCERYTDIRRTAPYDGQGGLALSTPPVSAVRPAGRFFNRMAIACGILLCVATVLTAVALVRVIGLDTAHTGLLVLIGLGMLALLVYGVYVLMVRLVWGCLGLVKDIKRGPSTRTNLR